MGIVIAGLPNNIPFNAPHLYSRQQLEQVALSLPQIVFFKTQQDNQEETAIKTESTDSLNSYNFIQTVPTMLSNGHIIQPTILKL